MNYYLGLKILISISKIFFFLDKVNYKINFYTKLKISILVILKKILS